MSPTASPLPVRNVVLTSTSPGPSYQWPEIIAYPIQELGPANTFADVDTPADLRLLGLS